MAVLPEYLLGVEASASMAYGKRTLCWTLREPGMIYRCRYAYAWIEVTEQQPWKGEPLHVSCTRRAGETSVRSMFSDGARKTIASEVLPALARDFGTLWVDRHRAGTRDLDERVDEEKRRLAWWEEAAWLADAHLNGRIEFRPVEEPEDSRERRIRVCSDSTPAGITSEGVLASAWCDGDQVGWMTRHGMLIPADDLLR